LPGAGFTARLGSAFDSTASGGALVPA
jgi:hypothetical protein